MIIVQALNGKIQLAEKKTLMFKEGAYQGFLYVSVVVDGHIADAKLNRAAVKELIAALEASLLWD